MKVHVFAFALALPTMFVTVALAQNQPGGGSGTGTAPGSGGSTSGGGTSGSSAGTGTGTGTGGAGTGAAPSTVTVTPGQTQFFPGGVMPPAPGQTLGGGNVQFSSSKPISGNERDGFDFQKQGAGGTVRGGENSSFIIGNGSGSQSQAAFSGPVPNNHNVRCGDTLWGICDFYFHNPYQWPRIWSYNSQIQNPHWIYPGDNVKLRTGAQADAPAATLSRGPAITDRRRQVPPDTVFLRNQGFIEDEESNWGELNGAREDKIFLTDFDEVYLRIAANKEIKVGQELTVYRPIKKVGNGKLIEIQGTVKVDQWDAKERVARARVTETLDTIERGARVGPIARRFEVVPPARNDKDVSAHVITSVHPHNFYGQNQVLFLDQGEQAGLKPGNRLFVIRKGDGFHKTSPAGSAAKRIALESESPAAMESIPAPRDDGALPEEVLAELRVVNVKKDTSMAIVTTSRREIEQGDLAVARRGY